MTTIIGMQAGDGKEGIILASDVSATRTEVENIASKYSEPANTP